MYVQGRAIQYEQYILKCAGATLARGGDLNIGFNLLQKTAFPISNCIFVKYIFGHIRNCHPKKTQVVHLMEQIPQKLQGIAQIPPSMILMTTTTSANPNPPSWQWPKVNICDGGVHQEFLLIISEKKTIYII